MEKTISKNDEPKDELVSPIRFTPCPALPERDLYLRSEEDVVLRRLFRLLQEENLMKVKEVFNAEDGLTGVSALFFGYYLADLQDAAIQVAKRSGLAILEARTSSLRIDSDKEIKDSVHSIFEAYQDFPGHDRSALLIVNDVETPPALRGGDNLATKIGLALKMEISVFRGILFLVSEKRESIPAELFSTVLYKIQFSKPDSSILEKKWIALSNGLLADHASYLARAFSLDTRQMLNVFRQVKIDIILDGIMPERERIAEYCKAELYDSRSSSIGF